MNCKHESFKAQISVARMVQNGDPEKEAAFAADIKIKCDQCGLPFEFIGLPGGFSPAQPMVNFDRTEMRAPLKPSSVGI